MRRARWLLVPLLLVAPVLADQADEPPLFDAMGLEITVGQYATITNIVSPNDPLAVVIPGSVYQTPNGKEGHFAVDVNCDASVTLGKLTDQIEGQAFHKQYLLRDMVHQNELYWDAHITATVPSPAPPGVVRNSVYNYSVPKGTAGVQFKVKLIAMPGTDWQLAYADTYQGAVTITVAAP